MPTWPAMPTAMASTSSIRWLEASWLGARHSSGAHTPLPGTKDAPLEWRVPSNKRVLRDPRSGKKLQRRRRIVGGLYQEMRVGGGDRLGTVVLPGFGEDVDHAAA